MAKAKAESTIGYGQRRWQEHLELVRQLATLGPDNVTAAMLATRAVHPKRSFVPRDVAKAQRIARKRATALAAAA